MSPKGAANSFDSEGKTSDHNTSGPAIKINKISEFFFPIPPKPQC